PSVVFALEAGPYVAADGRVALYFTRPGLAPGEDEDPELDDALVEVIDAAIDRIDLCLYEFKRTVVVDAVLAAQARGVAIRFVGDGDEAQDSGYQALESAGVPRVLRPAGDRIMHNKFAVVDDRFVFSGSTNATDTGVLKNNNNALIFDSPALATAYTTEFDRMFAGDFGGQKSVPEGPDNVTFGAPGEPGTIDVTAEFSPNGQPLSRVREALAGADHSVFFMVFSFTHKDIASDLLALHASGVEVAGIFDESQANGSHSKDEELAAAGIPTYLDGNKNSSGFAGGKLHHKVMIIDAGTDSEPTVITGSFNWSTSATEYNDENLLVLRGAEIVQPFLAELCARLDEAVDHEGSFGERPEPCARRHHALRINEVLARPTAGDSQFIEVVNTGGSVVNLRDWSLGDSTEPRYIFEDVLVGPGGVAVAVSADLQLQGPADTVVLRDPTGAASDAMGWEHATFGVSFNRADDGADTGGFVAHTDFGAAASPGTYSDGSSFDALHHGGLIVINEVFASQTSDQFVEVVSLQTAAVPLTGWTLEFDGAHVHTFDDSGLAAGDAIVVELKKPLAHSGTLTLWDAEDRLIDSATWVDHPGIDDVSLNRALDSNGDLQFVPHRDVPGAFADRSPGARVTGHTWAGPQPDPSVVLNEVLANPSGSDTGNEFVEIVNAGSTSVHLAAWTVGDKASPVRHQFSVGDWLRPGEALVIYDSGEHPNAYLASSGSLSLNNSNEIITLRDSAGNVASQVSYSSSRAGVSLVREVDGDATAGWVYHDEIPGTSGSTSPLTQSGGESFAQ
ncbi:MAG: phosphatidylserine/phosphatidylglycerophosphate/cardiolipin synthase-like enzyme, partial [Myxococcota bacterium]